jgi:hypothetical protein
MFRIPIVILILSLSPIFPHAKAEGQQVIVEQGYIAGTHYRDMVESARGMYVMGVVDGFLASTMFGGSHPRALWLKSCITGVNTGQLVAIIDRFISEHPERWDQGMHVLVYSALLDACAERGYGPPPSSSR